MLDQYLKYHQPIKLDHRESVAAPDLSPRATHRTNAFWIVPIAERFEFVTLISAAPRVDIVQFPYDLNQPESVWGDSSPSGHVKKDARWLTDPMHWSHAMDDHNQNQDKPMVFAMFFHPRMRGTQSITAIVWDNCLGRCVLFLFKRKHWAKSTSDSVSRK